MDHIQAPGPSSSILQYFQRRAGSMLELQERRRDLGHNQLEKRQEKGEERRGPQNNRIKERLGHVTTLQSIKSNPP